MMNDGTDGAYFFALLQGLQKGLDVQGPLKFSNVRSDAGLYLQYDVGYHLRVPQQQYTIIEGSAQPGAAANEDTGDQFIRVPGVIICTWLAFNVIADFTTQMSGAIAGYRPPLQSGFLTMIPIAQWSSSATGTDRSTFAAGGGGAQVLARPMWTMPYPTFIPANSIVKMLMRVTGAFAGPYYWGCAIAHTNDRGEPLR